MGDSGATSICYRFQAALSMVLFVSCFLINQNSCYLPPTSAANQVRVRRADSEATVRQRIRFSEKIWKRELKSRQDEKAENDIFWGFLSPVFDCPHDVESLGNTGPGRKWICGLKHFEPGNSPCVVFSYGIASDISFEDDILKRTICNVYTFDPTMQESDVTVLDKYPGRAHFTEIGLGAANPNETVSSLKNAMKAYKVEFIDILKIDVFGKEYKVMNSILKDFPQELPIGQVFLEIHVSSEWSKRNLDNFKRWWESLEAVGLRVFKYECHMSSPPVQCCQVSFLNVKVDHRILHRARDKEIDRDMIS